ncbi:AI-2E family transporter [Arcobacter sp. LA11]|uniref:AI-2E family transporter n=1 Tax=Arcobacter sp. LA11 TaxID=1898176 RepID=UPI0009F84959|nr:AI-2E family transporter [Arcobacter sp. LA11]
MKPQYFLVALAIVTIFFMFQLFSPFLKPMIVALLLAVATNSLNTYLKRHIPNNFISSSLMTVLLTAIFFIPVLYCIFSFATLINKIDQQALISIYEVAKEWVENMPDDFIFVKEQLNSVLQKIDIPEFIQKLLSIGALLGKNSAKFIIDMVMILVFYFFFNFYSTSLSHYFKDALPLKKEDSNALFYESSNVMSVVLYSILATAVLEGFLFGVFVSFFGYDGILLGVLYGFASLVPVIGGLLMWLPVAIYEMFTGSTGNALAIAIYSIVVISIIADTFIKPVIIKYINQKVVKTPTDVNELLIFFAIVAGLSTFGFWGMIIGPAMVTFFISLVQLLKKFSNDFYSIEQTVENSK